MLTLDEGRETGDVLLDDIACFGNESSLLECDADTTPFCFHFEDAGVICPIPGTVRTWPHHTHYTIHCFSLHCVCDVHYVYNPAFMRPWNGMRIVRARRGRAWEQGYFSALGFGNSSVVRTFSNSHCSVMSVDHQSVQEPVSPLVVFPSFFLSFLHLFLVCVSNSSTSYTCHRLCSFCNIEVPHPTLAIFHKKNQ